MGNSPKGLTHHFGQKFELSSLFGFVKKGPEMMFGDVLDTKEAFLDHKNMYLICPKNRKFSKRVNQ